MTRQIICDGDTLVFLAAFGHRTITTLIDPAIIRGSGHATVNNKKMCVLGDELKVKIKAQYTVPGHTPGVGVLCIAQVANDQKTPGIKGLPPLLVKGGYFDASFMPTQPAMKSGTPPTPDPTTPTTGKGQFVPAQLFATAKG